MDNNNIDKITQKLSKLEKQSKAKRERRIENTMSLFKDIAEKEMVGKEKEDFLETLGQKSSKKEDN